MRTVLRIAGMRAVHAVRAVHTALTPVEGIFRLDVRMGEAVVEHDGRASCSVLRDAIAAAGFDVVDCRNETRALPTL